MVFISLESLVTRDYLVKIIRGGKMDHPFSRLLVNEYSMSKTGGQAGRAACDPGEQMHLVCPLSDMKGV